VSWGIGGPRGKTEAHRSGRPVTSITLRRQAVEPDPAHVAPGEPTPSPASTPTDASFYGFTRAREISEIVSVRKFDLPLAAGAVAAGAVI
jgi:hypothetical protein